jgi:hypothetical protein
MSLKKLRKQLLIWLAHDIALPYFKLVRKNYRFPYNLESLQQCETGSVGRELYHFFYNNGLDMLPHYEKHDIKHVVLGYAPTETGEVCFQCFMLANGRITIPVLFSVTIGLLIMPESWPAFRKAWKRGRAIPSLNKLDWFALVPRQLSGVREKLQLNAV